MESLLYEELMPPELAQWITPAILILGFLYLDRSIRHLRGELQGEIKDLRERIDSRIGDLRDRMGRIEGTLDVLRDFFVRNGRGTAA